MAQEVIIKPANTMAVGERPTNKRFQWSLVMGAAFLMATSAVGPGFLTQTTVFTQTLGASFAFVVLVSIILDIGAQLNIWRVIVVSKKRAQDIANELLPGLGIAIAGVVALGGLAFNVANLGGAGMGMHVLFPTVSPELGAGVTAILAIGIFLLRSAGKMMDRFSIVMGTLLLGMMLYALFSTSPPIGQALYRMVWPEHVNALSIVTLVGGSVGGYITFAGAHRLIDSQVVGQAALPQVNKATCSSIGMASLVRVILFLTALGVVSQGIKLDPNNPPASMFFHATGQIGYKLFGMVLWTAAITSVVGAAYTSVSFLKTLHPAIERHANRYIILFIVASCMIFCVIGKPVFLLIIAGALNGFILPMSLAIILIAARRTDIVGDYRHPRWMSMFGWGIAILMAGMSLYTLVQMFLS